MRADEISGELARILDGVANGCLRNLVEYHAMDRLAVECLLLLEEFDQMPADRLAFAVRVSREVQGVGLLQRPDDRFDVFLVALDDLILHGEAIRRIDRTFFRHEIADVAI